MLYNKAFNVFLLCGVIVGEKNRCFVATYENQCFMCNGFFIFRCNIKSRKFYLI